MFLSGRYKMAGHCNLGLNLAELWRSSSRPKTVKTHWNTEFSCSAYTNFYMNSKKQTVSKSKKLWKTNYFLMFEANLFSGKTCPKLTWAIYRLHLEVLHNTWHRHNIPCHLKLKQTKKPNSQRYVAERFWIKDCWSVL